MLNSLKSLTGSLSLKLSRGRGSENAGECLRELQRQLPEIPKVCELGGMRYSFVRGKTEDLKVAVELALRERPCQDYAFSAFSCELMAEHTPCWRIDIASGRRQAGVGWKDKTRHTVYLIPFLNHGAGGRPALLVGRMTNHSSTEPSTHNRPERHIEHYRFCYMMDLLPPKLEPSYLWERTQAAFSGSSDEIAVLATWEVEQNDPFFDFNSPKLCSYFLAPNDRVGNAAVAFE